MPKPDWPIVVCPGCRVPMGVRQVTKDGPGKPTGQVVYVCEICKMETTRHYKATMRQPIQQQQAKSDTDNNGV